MNVIARLDSMIARHGTSVTLRRMTAPTPTDFARPASWRPYAPEEVTGGIVAGDFKVVLSPTGMQDAAWIAAFAATGGESLAAPFDVPAWVPKRGDKIVVDNRLRSIEHVLPYKIGAEIVRIELQVR